MGGKRRTSEEIAYVLAQAEAGVPIKELCRKYGVSEATFYAWRKKFDGLTPSELKRLKQLEEENRKLKRLVADLALDKQILQDAISGKLEARGTARARPEGRGPVRSERTSRVRAVPILAKQPPIPKHQAAAGGASA